MNYVHDSTTRNQAKVTPMNHTPVNLTGYTSVDLPQPVTQTNQNNGISSSTISLEQTTTNGEVPINHNSNNNNNNTIDANDLYTAPENAALLPCHNPNANTAN